jgi:ATP-binding cassette subfamily B protein
VVIDAFGLLLRLLDGARRQLLISAALAVVQSALLIPVALLVKRAFDHQVPDGDTHALAISGVLVAGLVVASTGLGLATRHLVLGATKASVERLRVALIDRLHSLPSAWFDRVEHGVIKSTVLQDTERLDVVGAALVAQLIPAAIVGIGLFAALLWVAPPLAAALVVIAPLLVLVMRLPHAALLRRTRAHQAAFDLLSVRVDFAVRAATLIRTDGAEECEAAQARAEAAAVTATGRRMSWLQYAVAQGAGAVSTVGGLAVLFGGAGLVATGDLTLGALLAFYALALPLRGQLMIVLQALPQLLSGAESMRRLEDVLADDAHEPYGGDRRIAFAGRIELRDIDFGFHDAVPVLQGAHLEIEPGEVVGLAGRNGAGKTTVAKLILGLYRPWSGDVLADGVSLDVLDVRSLRRQIGFVPQHPVLFPGTIAQNIRFGDTASDLASVQAAAVQATADAVLDALPGGLDASVGDDGRLVSGGQAQRVALARALLRRPALLILDEPTTHLDAGAAKRVLHTLRSLEWRPSLLLISHDPAVLELADRVYTLAPERTTAI